MKGRGDYSMSPDEAAATIQKAVKAAVGRSIRSAGGGVGNFLGSKIGMGAAGRSLGRGVGARLSRLLGTGEYTTNQGDMVANSLFGRGGQTAGGPGTFESMGGGIRLKHREYIQDIFLPTTVGAAFTNAAFIVNPGLSFVFPYLAQIAANFEQYKFHGLVFEFVSSTSQYGQTALGTYVMAMEYNSAAPVFTTKPQMENSDYALSARLDKSGMYGVECAKGSQAQEYFYVRAPGQATVSNLYDLGIMQLGVATTTVAAGGTGLVAGSAIGELWVTYDVELIRPRISVFRPGYSHIRTTGGVNPANPLGAPAARTITSFGSLTGVTCPASSIQFPNASVGDVYSIMINWTGTVTAALVYPTPTITGFAPFTILSQNTRNDALTVPLPATGTEMSVTYYLIVTNDQPQLVSLNILAATGVFPAGTQTCDVIITNLGNGLQPTTM